jgi:uncharacterized protein (TIGR02145 family)
MKNRLKKIITEVAAVILLLLLIVSCQKEDTDTVTDFDGNVYKTISAGGNIWMAENLRTTKFRDGTAIPMVTGASEWAALSTYAYCWPENNASNKGTFGGLYNGYAVLESRGLCPTGWHIPSDAEWIDLELELGLPQAEAYLDAIRGESQNVGGKLRATTNWEAPNLGANNSSGFSAYGTGYRRPPGEFTEYKAWTGYLTTTPTTTQGNYWMRYLGYTIQGIDRHERDRQYGYSVRCVKD